MRVHRPWGFYETIAQGGGYLVKEITVLAGRQFSLQYHKHRSEVWKIIKGNGIVSVGPDSKVRAQPGGVFIIPKEMVHRMTAVSDITFVEIQAGEVLSEEDIVRIRDDYGRA